MAPSDFSSYTAQEADAGEAVGEAGNTNPINNQNRFTKSGNGYHHETASSLRDVGSSSTIEQGQPNQGQGHSVGYTYRPQHPHQQRHASDPAPGQGWDGRDWGNQRPHQPSPHFYNDHQANHDPGQTGTDGYWTPPYHQHHYSGPHTQSASVGAGQDGPPRSASSDNAVGRSLHNSSTKDNNHSNASSDPIDPHRADTAHVPAVSGPTVPHQAGQAGGHTHPLLSTVLTLLDAEQSRQHSTHIQRIDHMHAMGLPTAPATPTSTQDLTEWRLLALRDHAVSLHVGTARVRRMAGAREEIMRDRVRRQHSRGGIEVVRTGHQPGPTSGGKHGRVMMQRGGGRPPRPESSDSERSVSGARRGSGSGAVPGRRDGSDGSRERGRRSGRDKDRSVERDGSWGGGSGNGG
ncbi:hypothetical protein HKX48_004134 [Thoreauomyces humboldtii]|nr:hypothetical protein HKX48_004134 [Thoreauomyces humboldtii]